MMAISSKTILKLVIVLVFILLGYIQSSPKALEDENYSQIDGVSTNTEENIYTVLSVVDGDTIKISEIGTIRLIGIDTPETVDPRKEVQCFGLEASNKMKELIEGKNVRLEFDSTQGSTDKYGRVLAYVYDEDGSFINLIMIEEGYAYEYTYSVPYKYQSIFKIAQTKAQSQKLGLWGMCN